MANAMFAEKMEDLHQMMWPKPESRSYSFMKVTENPEKMAHLPQ